MRLENQEMSRALPSKEAAVRSVRQQLEEKTRECSAVSRQLQQAVEDAQRQVRSLHLSNQEDTGPVR